MISPRTGNRPPRRDRRAVGAFLLTFISACAMLATALLPLRPTALAAQADPTVALQGNALGGPGGAPIIGAGVNPLGTNVFLHKEAEQWKVTKTLEMVQAAGIKWIKQDFPWSDIEITAKGDFTDKRNPDAVKSAWDKYDFIMSEAQRLGLQVVARITFAPAWARAADSGANDAPTNYQDLADFVVALLDHYQGKLGYVQIWNEPNLKYEWKANGRVDPAGYVDMLKTVYTAAKAKHPDVKVLSAPMAINLETIDYAGNLNELDFWDQMYKAGAKAYFDILSANAYGLDLPPTDPPSKDKLNFRRVELLRQVMESNDDAGKAIWFNEYGWNASPTSLSEEQQLRWRRVDADTQAKWTVEGIQYAQQNWPWAGVFFIWYFRQVGDIQPDNAEYYFELVSPDFTPLPVYTAVQQYAQQLAQQGATATPAAADTATPAAVETPLSVDTPTPPPAVATNTAAAPAPTDTPAAVVPTATPAATPTTAVAGSSGGGDNTIFFIIGGVLILAGLGVAGFLLTRRKV